MALLAKTAGLHWGELWKQKQAYIPQQFTFFYLIAFTQKCILLIDMVK